MGIALRQSTASQEIPLGYFLDSTNGDTEETGLTIANTDIKLWKAGATTLANKNSGGATHISNGLYYAVLDATDTDTLGPLVIFVHVAGALAVRVECEVYPANVYDSLFSTDKLEVDIKEIGGAAQSATNLDKAAKSIVNKAIQNKSTGVIVYYDDDGITSILTHTPTDTVAEITRTPS
jgi:hypothetical protein